MQRVVLVLLLASCASEASEAGTVDAASDAAGSNETSSDTASADTASADTASDDTASADTAADAPGADAASCTPTTVVLGKAPTSACSFAIPAPYDKFKVNVFIVSGGKKLVCPRADGGSCDGAGGPGGWFWAGEKIALCDASCIEFGDGAGQLVAELGCPRLTCK